MPEIRRPAIKIEQGKRTLFLTSFRVRDFTDKNFYRVDKLDVERGTGMQRLLDDGRAKKLGKDIVAAHDEAFLPTSIFLATSESIGYDEEKKELFFESGIHAGICPLDVVDGQHRIEGLKMAAIDDERLLDFPVSVIIGHELSEYEKMLQFVIVNTKQEKVGPAIEQGIIARFSKKWKLEKFPHLPLWLQNRVESKKDLKALDFIIYLNNEESSPWNGRICLAGRKKDTQHTINQASIVKSIQSNILFKHHSIKTESDLERRKEMLKIFWMAVRDIFVDPSDDAISNSIVFKYNGVEFFHSITHTVFDHVNRFEEEDFSKETIEKCIKSAEKHLTDVSYIMHPDFWKSTKGRKTDGSEIKASKLNKAGVSDLVQAFNSAMAEEAKARKDSRKSGV